MGLSGRRSIVCSGTLANTGPRRGYEKIQPRWNAGEIVLRSGPARRPVLDYTRHAAMPPEPEIWSRRFTAGRTGGGYRSLDDSWTTLDARTRLALSQAMDRTIREQRGQMLQQPKNAQRTLRNVSSGSSDGESRHPQDTDRL